MNDKPLAPVRLGRLSGRTLTAAALGALLFGAVGCSVPEATAPATSESATADASSGGTGSGDATASAARDVVAQAPDATAAEALNAAQKLFAGKPTKIALDHRIDGTLEYDIELLSSTEKYEVELGADTLEVLSEEREPLDPGDDDLQEVFDLGAVVDLDRAATTARESRPGVINEWTLEGNSDGSVIYEFDIMPDGATDEVEVLINALTNELLPGS